MRGCSVVVNRSGRLRRDVTWHRQGPGAYSSELGLIRRERNRTWTWYPGPPLGKGLVRSGYRTLGWAKQDAALESGC